MVKTACRSRSDGACSGRSGLSLPAGVLLGLLLLPVMPSPAAAQGASDAEPILEALKGLESRSDAKCHSTFCRFEDFLNGTPLSSEARVLNVDEQKALVRRIWVEAGVAARAAGQRSLGPALIRNAASELLTIHDDGDGAIRVVTPSHPPVSLPAVRVRQYGSIAYSLRAILGIQQESLFDPGPPLITLRADGVEELKMLLDRATLSVLMVADQAARKRSRKEISEDGIRDAWRKLFPSDEEARPAGPDLTAKMPAAPGGASEAMDIFFSVIGEKVEAYYRYNGLEDPARRDELFAKNVERFFTLHSHAASAEDSTAFGNAFFATAVRFTRRLMEEAARPALAQGRGMMGAPDAYAAVEMMLPHEIDDFEDAHLFPRLEREERLSLEAYDTDSMRDFGLHWIMMGQAIQSGVPMTTVPDPFAAEIMAEAISIYNLAVLRLSGKLAREDSELRPLRPEDLKRSASLLEERAVRNNAAPERPGGEEKILSVASRDHGGSSAFFEEATEESRIRYTHRSASWLSEFRRSLPTSPPTFSGGGIAAEDVDGDGDTDLLFVGGEGNALYSNEGRGRFRDVTEEAGLSMPRQGKGPGEARQPLIADFDNDGRQDILITFVDAPHRIYRNSGSLAFTDVTAQAGLGGPGFIGGPAVTFDFDGDGLLDLYICNFGDYLSGENPRQSRHNDNAQPNQLFRNLGGFRFENATAGSGTADKGWAQAVSHADVDRDGRQDIIVANDFGRNAILRNLGEGRFEDISLSLGMDKAYHSMNVGISDLNADTFPDIYISNIATVVKDNKYVLPNQETPLKFDPSAMATMIVKESNILYMSSADAGRLSAYSPSNLLERGDTSTGWAWDAEFLDYDNDGDDDLYVVNGSNPYFMRGLMRGMTHHKYFYNYYDNASNVFFLNDGGMLRNASAGSGTDYVGNSRSTAYLDLEGDGDLDIALNDFHAPARILKNRSEKTGNRWAKVRLVGDPAMGSTRDAVGARMVATTGDGLTVTREIQGGSGFLSMNPKEQHFGLGRARRFDLLITWPGGRTQSLQGLKSGRSHLIRQEPGEETDRASEAGNGRRPG